MTIKKKQPIIKNKKISQRGFTLIEILAAITILGILTAIAVVSVTKIIENGKEKHYTTAEENLSLAGQSYVQQNRGDLPKAIGQKKKVPLKTLVDKNYIAPIKDYSENDCDMEKSYVQIYKYSQSDYSYVAYLDCPNYTSKDKLKDITPKIEAVIDENEDARTAHARIKITGNEKIVSYSYILYRNNKQIKNTGNIQEKEMPETRNINFSLEDYTPGNIKLVVTATNTYGNTKTVTVTKNIPDQKDPVCIIKEEDKADSPKAWIKDRNGERKITVGCDDGETGSGCTRKEYSKTFRDSMRTGKITIEDESGNKTDCEVSVYIDKVNPTITVNAYKRDASGKKTGSVLKTISTTTSDNSKTIDLTSLSSTEWLNKSKYPNGIYYEIKLNDNLEVATYNLKGNATGLTKNHSAVNTITRTIENASLSATSKTKNTSITTDGYNKTKVEISDAAGNSANVTMITPVDITAPTVPNISMYKWTNNSTPPSSASGLLTYTNDTWSNKNVYTVASGSTDAMSGFKEYQYTTTGETTNNENKAATTRNIQAEGISYIKYRACDVAGNCSSYTDNKTIKIDNTPPTCQVTGGSTTWINASSSTTKRTITATCVDNGSKCDSSRAVISKDYSTDINVTNAGAVGVGEGGTVYDNAGNAINCAANQTVKIDKTAPTAPTVSMYKWNNNSTTPSSASGLSTYTNDTWSNKNVYTVASGSTDATSGIKNYQYTTTGVTSNVSNEAGTTRNIKAEGTSTIKYRVCDNAGNCTPYSSTKTVKVDKTNPTCSVTGGNTAWINASSTTTSRTITATCSDDISGCATAPFSKTYSSDINTTKAGAIDNNSGGTVYDNAGNSVSCAANQTVKIDKTAPSTPTVSLYKWANNSTAPTSTSGLSAYSNNTWSNKKIYTVASGVTDATSGLKEYQYTTTGTTTHNTNKAASTRNVEAEGTSYIKYRACDNAGNCSGYSTNYTLKIDKTSPTCTNSGDSTSWTKNNRTIYWGCSDATSGCNSSYSGSSQTFSSSTKTSSIAAYTIKDNAGNSVSCAARTANVYVDKTAPTCSNSGDSTTWTNSNRTIYWGCSDSHSGCNSSYSGSSATYSSTTKTASIGAYTIKDAVGNETSCPARTANVYVDKTAPTCSNSGDSTTWTNSNRTIYWGCSDSHSGCNSSYSGSSATYSSTTKTASIGAYTIKDNAGNSVSCAARTANVYVDKTSPTCTNSGDSTTWTNGNRTIYWGCSDSNSGCNSSYSGSSATYSSTTKTASIGAYTIKDNAGNSVSCPARTANVYVDKTAPTAPTVALVKGDWGELSNNTWQPYAFYTSGSTNSSSPYPSSSDSHSGISKYQISPNNSTWYDWNYWDTTTYSNKLYRNYGDGTTYRYVRAVDRAGNVSSVTTKTIKQDTTAPVCGNVTGASTSWTTSNRTISVACSDAASGCTATSYSNTWSSGKTQTSTIRIYDNAGNYTDCGVNVYVDKTTPQVSVSGNMNNWVVYENKGCNWYGRAKWNGSYCTTADGYCDNTAGKVTTSISGNVVTFSWYVANGAESYIGGSYWVKFIIKNSSGTEIYSTYLKEAYNPNTWEKGGNFSGTLSYTFNDVGTYYVYMDGNTSNSPKYDWTMGTITVTKG